MVVVGDTNDNPMKPGNKEVFVWKTQVRCYGYRVISLGGFVFVISRGTMPLGIVLILQPGGSEACLGRVYVEDPDDWDVGDKSFQWASTPHPHFTLEPATGELYARPTLGEGR